MDPHISPIVSNPQQLMPSWRQRHGARLEHCGASNVPRFELRATWLGRVQCRCQATSTWSGRCLEKPRLAPGAGEIWLVKSGWWKERRKGTQKVGYVMWLIYFLYFSLVCRCCYLICWELFPIMVAKQSQVQDDMFPFLEGSDLASKQKCKFFSSWKRECNSWRFPSERDMFKKGTLQCPELLYGDPGW